MATAIDSRQNDFSEMDNAGISKEHWKIMFISGMGFFTDAYDLFIIGVVMALLKPMWHVGKVEEGLVESTALLAAAIGALLFGRIADMLGRKRIYGVEVLVLAAGRHRLRLLAQHLVAHRLPLHPRHRHRRRLSRFRHHHERVRRQGAPRHAGHPGLRHAGCRPHRRSASRRRPARPPTSRTTSSGASWSPSALSPPGVFMAHVATSRSRPRFLKAVGQEEDEDPAS